MFMVFYSFCIFHVIFLFILYLPCNFFFIFQKFQGGSNAPPSPPADAHEVRIITVERRPVPRRISPFRYNRQRTSINRFLKRHDTFTRGRLVFAEATDQDSQDGVHLRQRASADLANLVEWHIQQFAGSNW